jgi:hypothetical protein
MILDYLAQLGDAQAITSADAYTNNSYKMPDPIPGAPRNKLDGEALALVFVVTTAAAGDGASMTDTFDFMAVESANSNLSSHSVMQQRRVPGAELVAGAIVVVNIPPGRPTSKYIGGRIELGTGDTVSVDCYLLRLEMVTQFLPPRYRDGVSAH